MSDYSNQITVKNNDPELKRRWQRTLELAHVIGDSETQREDVAFILDRFDESIARMRLGEFVTTYDALDELHRKEAEIINGAVETCKAKAAEAERAAQIGVNEAEARAQEAVAAKEAAEAERDALAAEVEALNARVAEKMTENAELAARVAELEDRIADIDEQQSIAAKMMEVLAQLSALQGGGEAAAVTAQQEQE